MANLLGDICQGCYSRVPPQRAVEVRRNDQIMNCEVCGRILVHYEVS
ncbi:MAG: C4-type zinc ribbon domain-containing protein [Candidatus Krumholzibacteria bacterium]|nr:C4-type zinc ribbon domain-containing protein [Candidatus Krumholzibacteria bacterium]